MIRCREIGASDLDAIAALLTRGFGGRSHDYWMSGLKRQGAREVPEGYPRFGYMLDHEGMPVGVLLLLYSAREEVGEAVIRCNLSSWYVEPAFRNYAPMLTKIAQRHKEVTYINVSPASWTWRIVEAQGFRPYCSGLFCSFPALSRASHGMTVEIISHVMSGQSRVCPKARPRSWRATRRAAAWALSVARPTAAPSPSFCNRCVSAAVGSLHRRCS